MPKQFTLDDLFAYAPELRQHAPQLPVLVDPWKFDDHIVRVAFVEGEPLWCASDVARAIGFADPDGACRTYCKSMKLLKAAELTALGISNPPTRGLNMIREPDLFRLTIKSGLPSADRFEVWVMETVLPTIRKTGSYSIRPTVFPKRLPDENFSAIGGIVKRAAPEKVMQGLALVANRINETARQTAKQNEAIITALATLLKSIEHQAEQTPDVPTAPPEDAGIVYWPMLEVAKREGIGCAGRRRLVQKMSGSMREWAIDTNRQTAVRRETDSDGKGKLVFHIDAIDIWLAERGSGIVQAYKAEFQTAGAPMEETEQTQA